MCVLYIYIRRPRSDDIFLFPHLAFTLWSRDHYHYSRRKASQCDCLDLVLFYRRTKKPKAWKQSHKMGMGIIETGNPSHMPMGCGSKADSQERDPIISLVEEGIGSVFYAWSGLIRHLPSLPPAAVRSALILLFTGDSKERCEG